MLMYCAFGIKKKQQTNGTSGGFSFHQMGHGQELILISQLICLVGQKKKKMLDG